MAQRITLKQVAAQAGVSYQTVSKVLNRQATVSKETEARIWDAVRTLGYRPNQIARNLRSQRNHMIGYSWEPTPPDQVNSILDLFMQSMSHMAERAGYHLLAFPYRSDRKEWLASYRELIDTNRVDAFVLTSVEFNDPRVEFLMERNFPFVAFGRSNPEWDFPYVDVDGGAGLRMIVEHLLERGHRRIAALAWPSASRVGQNRIAGYLDALRRSGIVPREDYVARGEGNYQFGYMATKRWLEWSREERPTAIAAFNDAMAIGAMHAIRDQGLSVGRDIAVTGFDDSPMVQYLTPPLTSIRQPIWEVGEKVIAILLGLLDGKPVGEQQVLLQPRLIIRQSSEARFSDSV